MATRRDILKGGAALGAVATASVSTMAQAGEDRRMRRPEVLFFDSNESMLDLSGMKPQVDEP